MGEEESERIAVSFVALAVASLLAVLMCIMFSGCSPKIVEKVVTQIEYKDRIVHDTTTFEIPVEVEKIVTRDTLSHLENTYAKSDAVVSGGFLSHSLESKPQIIKIPVEVHVTDTLWRESEIKETIKEVPAPLSWWQKFKMEGFWFVLVGFVIAVFAIIKLIKK